jgi:hypothetical protein
VRQSQQLVIRAATIIEFNRGMEQNPIEEGIMIKESNYFFPYCLPHSLPSALFLL